MQVLLRAVLVGILATLTMDALSVGAAKLRLIAPLPPNLMGRWFASVARGRPLHSDIAQAPPYKREMAIALPVHYAIGVTLALLYLVVTASLGLDQRKLVVALAFAVCTNVFPWLIMFPAMGYGWLGLRGSSKTRLLRSSFVSHLFYGIGLWLGAWIFA